VPAALQFHWCHFAFLFNSPRLSESLQKIFAPDKIRLEIVSPRKFGMIDRFPTHLLCVDLEHVAPADDVREQISSIGIRGFESLFEGDEEMRAANQFTFLRDKEGAAEERNRLQCAAWLSQQIEARVSYWFHEGDNGLNGEYFFGFGSDPTMLVNFMEGQGFGWNPANPRSAQTAALWHIGVNVPNRNEAASVYFDPRDGLASLANSVREEPAVQAIQESLPKLPEWLKSNPTPPPQAQRRWWRPWA
jgi:hypothetical protein